MDQSPQVNGQRAVDPDALIRFIDALRDAGFRIGATEYIAAHDLILALSARGEPVTDPERLESYLRPLLCNSIKEQAEFGQYFAAWVTRLLPASRGSGAAPVVQIESPAAPAVSLGTRLIAVARSSRNQFLVGWIIVVLGALAMFALYQRSTKTGTVEIHSAPDGATVRLAGDADVRCDVAETNASKDSAVSTTPAERRDSLGRTPLQCRIDLGSHQFLIGLAGYIDSVATVPVRGDSVHHIEVTLRKAATGLVRIVSRPTGAAIVFQKLPAGDLTHTEGDAPGAQELEVGTYAAQLSLEGYEDRIDTVRVVEGETIERTIDLTPLPSGFLSVSSNPTGASVYLGGTASGVTPLERLKLTTGTVQVRVVLPGYAHVDTAVAIVANGHGSVVARLQKPALRSLTIHSNPSGAQVALQSRADAAAVGLSDSVRIGVAPAAWNDVPEGNYIVTLSLDGFEDASETLTVRGENNQQLTVQLRRIRRERNKVLFGSTDDTMSVRLADGSVRVWNTRTWMRDTLVNDTLIDEAVRAGVYSPDGTRLAQPGDSGRIVLMNAATGEANDTLNGHTSPVTSLAYSRDGRLFASGDASGLIRLWTTRPEPFDTLPAPSGTRIAFSPDGRLLATGGSVGEIVLWNMDTRQQEHTLDPEDLSFTLLAFSPDGRTLAAGSVDPRPDGRVIKRWDVETGSERAAPAFPPTTSIGSLLFDPNDGSLITVSGSGLMRGHSLNLESGAPTEDSVIVPNQRVREIAASHDGHVAAILGTDDTVRIVLLSFPRPPPWNVTDSAASTVAVSPDGKMFATGGVGGPIRLWDIHELASGDTITASSRAELPAIARRLVFAPGGPVLASVGVDSIVHLWNVRSGALVDSLVHSSPVSDIAFSADGILACLLDSGRVVLWSVGPGRPLLAQVGEIHSLSFSSDGRRLASAASDSSVILWDTHARAPRDRLKLDDAAESVAYSPTSERLAVATSDSVIIWNTSGSRLKTATTWATESGPLLLLALATLIAPFLWRRLAWRRRAQQFLVRRQSDVEPEIERIALGGIDRVLFGDLTLFQVARRFRRRVDVPSTELDVYATALATSRRGGIFTPGFARRQITPEYLALIDRTTRGDQQAQFVDDLLNRLAQDNVLITRYYFDGDPRVCFPRAERERPVTLQNLAQRFPDHRLLLFADTRGLFSSITGARETWTEQLLQWTDRAIMTPEPRENWGAREVELSADFVVRAASPGGLATLRDTAPRSETRATSRRTPAPYPALLRQRARRWVERDAPPTQQIDDMIALLRAYLGDDGFFWLAACAVYPALNWKLTLNLGYALRGTTGERLLNGDRLLAMARLPWFRYGTMPDWMRLRLLDEFAPEQERQVRNALEALFLSAVAGKADIYDLEIAKQQKRTLHALTQPLLRRLSQRAPRRHALKDHVFLSFMEGRSAERLAVRVPQTVVALVGGSGAQKTTPRLAAEAQRLRSALLAAPTLTVLFVWAGNILWQLIPAAPVPPRLELGLGIEVPGVPTVTPTESVEPNILVIGIIGLIIVSLYLITRNRASLQRRLATNVGPHARAWLQPKRVGWLVAGSAAVLALTWTAVAYVSGQQLAREARVRIRTANDRIAFGTDSLPTFAALAALDSLRMQRDIVADRARGPQARLALDSARPEALLADMRYEYFSVFNRLLLSRARGRIDAFLRAQPETPTESTEYDAVYDALKTYLIINLHADRANRDFLTPVLMRFWLNGAVADSAVVTLARRQFDFYASEMLIEAPFSSGADDLLIRRTRQLLTQFSGPDIIYASLIRQAANAPPVSWVDPTSIIANSLIVPAAFTRSGAQAIDRLLESPSGRVSPEPWVMGDSAVAAPDLGRLADELRRRYQDEYADHWSRFVRGARISRFRDVPDAISKLRIMGDSATSPLVRFVATVTDNVLDTATTGATQQANRLLLPTALFRSNYLRQIQDLSTSLQNYQSSTTAAPSAAIIAAQGSADAIARAALDAGELVSANGAAHEVALAVAAFLEVPANQAKDLLERELTDPSSKSDVNDNARAFCRTFDQLTSKFPFDPGSPTEATFEEVTAVLAPGRGALWQFYEKHLRDVLDQKGTEFTQGPDAARKASPAFIAFFNRAADASRALFSGKGEELGFDFVLSDFHQYREGASTRYVFDRSPLDESDRVTVLIDGQSVTIFPGQSRSTTFQWRARTAGDKTRSSIVLTPSSSFRRVIAEAQGRWATFKVFYTADFTSDAVSWSPAGIRPIGTRIDFPDGLQLLNRAYLSQLRPCVPNVLR